MQIYKSPILLLGFFFFISALGIAQRKISIDSISAYIGQTVTVCSKVFSTHNTKGEKPVIYLNLGASFPDQKLTLVIFQKDRPNFPSSPEEYYNLQEVCATGKLKEYKGKAEMILSSQSEIKIF
jgi:hypothetical protein